MFRRVVVASDTHVGAYDGICPKVVKLNKRNKSGLGEYRANEQQLELLKNWKTFADAVGHVDCLIFNGDLTDGTNKKAEGTGLWTADRSIQADAFVELAEMFDYDRCVVTQGSLYHTSDNISSDHYVADLLNADFDDDMAVKVDNVRFHVQHKTGVSKSSWQYRATPIAKDMMLAVLAEPEFGKFDVILRAHAHYYVSVGYAHSYGAISPCWKGRDSFAKRNLAATAPTNGALIFDVDGNDYTPDLYTFTLKKQHLITEVVI
jgi:hypothetical protein